MCGLVGAIGTSSLVNYRVFEQLLMVDSVRGLDSTGVLAVFRDWSFRVKKAIGPPFNLLFRDDYIKQVENSKEPPFVLMGHNRAATKGVVNHKNAHPFIHHPIILAHNGTLTSTHTLHKTYTNPYDTDSEAICAFLATHSVQEMWMAIRGAAALSWWDTRDHSLNLITNGERPLNICMSTAGTNLYWASESWMLTGILGRHRVAHQPIQSLNPHYHAKFVWDYDKKAISETYTKLEHYKPPFQFAPFYPVGTKGRMTNKPDPKPGKGVKGSSSFRLYDPINKQDFVWVQGKKHYLFSTSITQKTDNLPMVVEDNTLSDEENVLSTQLLKSYPECGWCNVSFDKGTILKGVVVDLLDACICEYCIDDPNVRDLAPMIA